MKVKIIICLIIIGLIPAASASMVDTVWVIKSSGFIRVNETLGFENYLVTAKSIGSDKAGIVIYKNQKVVGEKELRVNDFHEQDFIRITLLGIRGKYSWLSISTPEDKAVWRQTGSKLLKWGEKYTVENYTVSTETFSPDSVNLTVSGKNTLNTEQFFENSSRDYGNLRIIAADINQTGSVKLELLTYPMPAARASISTDKDEYYPDETVQVSVETETDTVQNIEGVVLESSMSADILPAAFSLTNVTGARSFRSSIKQPPENSTITITATVWVRDYFGNGYSTTTSKVIRVLPLISIRKWTPRDTDEQNLTVELYVYNGGQTEESVSIYDTVIDEKLSLKQLNWTVRLRPGDSANITYPVSPQKLGRYILPPAVAKWKKNASYSNEVMMMVHRPLIVITKSASKINNLINVKININNSGDRSAMVNVSDNIPDGSPVTRGDTSWSGFLEAGESAVITYSLQGDAVVLPAAEATYRDIRGIARQARSEEVGLTVPRDTVDKKVSPENNTASPLDAKQGDILAFMLTSFMAISGIIAGAAVVAMMFIRLKDR
ncbi:MAG: hypothetical protein OIN66_14035 [Candidatus Methanoperedens sp.]|nr:hypothetical protein [Candidatus Methanoperedens sp.]